ncbi:MAG TPA: HNH endonuclease [Gemmatimonadales bacterium]
MRIQQQVIAHAVAYGIPCAACNKLIDPPGRWPRWHSLSPSVDHIVPMSADPSRAHDITNLRAMHYGCNSRRGDGEKQRMQRAW